MHSFSPNSDDTPRPLAARPQGLRIHQEIRSIAQHVACHIDPYREPARTGQTSIGRLVDEDLPPGV